MEQARIFTAVTYRRWTEPRCDRTRTVSGGFIMKVGFRILASVVGLVFVFGLIDTYFSGFAKYLLWGLTVSVLLIYNEKSNHKS